MSARVRNLIAFLAVVAAGLVAFDYMTGGEWAQFVGGLVGSLIR